MPLKSARRPLAPGTGWGGGVYVGLRGGGGGGLTEQIDVKYQDKFG